MFDDWLFGEPITKGFDGALSEGKRTDARVKYCPKCKFCWELDKYQSQQYQNKEKDRKAYNYYENFPKYGKEKKVCPRCKQLK